MIGQIILLSLIMPTLVVAQLPIDLPTDCAAVTCIREPIEPQCCDGVFYPNLCLASCDNEENVSSCVPGLCDFPTLPSTPAINLDGPVLDCSAITCPSTSTSPRCCNGQTFNNLCLAACSLSIKEITECTLGSCVEAPEFDCAAVLCSIEEIDPVCCNGIFFANTCLAKCSGGVLDVDEQCTAGECPPFDCAAVTCSSEFTDPLCCKNETFLNPCLAACSLETTDIDPLCTPGVCEEDPLVCIAVFDPVCCDGTTYPNQCEAGVELGFPQADDLCTPGECGSIELPPCEILTFCFVDPCDFAECPSFPEAVCLSNYCNEPFQFLGTQISGPCTAVWVDLSQPAVIPQDQC